MKGLFLAILGLGAPLALMIALFGLRGSLDRSRSAPAAPTVRKAVEASPKPAPLPSAPPFQPASAPSILDLLDNAGDWWPQQRSASESEKSQAGRLLAARDFDRAARAFDRLLVASPNDPTLLLGKGMALAGLGRHEDALPLFESAAGLDPADSAARFNRAVTLARLGEADAAVTGLRELLDRHPAHLRARFNLAALLQSGRRHREALNLWREVTEAPAAAARPDGAAESFAAVPRLQAWSHRGECAMHIGLISEAESCFQQVTEQEPANAGAWTNLGIAQAAAGNRKAASEALNRALQINPKLLPALNQLAYVQALYYRDIGDAGFKESALDLCRRSLSIASEQGNIRQLRRALEHEGQEDEPAEAEQEPPAAER